MYYASKQYWQCTFCHDDETYFCIGKYQTFRIILEYYVYINIHTLPLHIHQLYKQQWHMAKLHIWKNHFWLLMAVNRHSYLNTFYHIYLNKTPYVDGMSYMLFMHLHSVCEIQTQIPSASLETDLGPIGIGLIMSIDHK